MQEPADFLIMSKTKNLLNSRTMRNEGPSVPLRVNRVGLAALVVCPVIGPFQTWRFTLEGVGPDVIPAPKLEPRVMRFELSDLEWDVIKPMLPNKPRGVPRVNDRRVLNGICWVLRSGAPWRDMPESYGPPATCYNRLRWSLGTAARQRTVGMAGRTNEVLENSCCFQEDVFWCQQFNILPSLDHRVRYSICLN